MAAPFRLYNTLSRSVEDFTPSEAGKVRLYFCGMTVYDEAHVGHARAVVTADMVTRYLRHRGWDVVLIRNYTDVDDKIIRRANERSENPFALAQRYIDSFIADCAGLGLTPPTHEPRVTQCIPEIRDLIQTLIDRGHAYSSDGSVWFDVRTFPEYGKLSGQKVEEVQSGDPEGGKRSPQDFALWKAAKAGEPSWESAWGPGRPGWHIECSAMAYKHAGVQLDIHGGGLDLVFPHHENEIAQSECAHGHAPYARYWLHNGLLTVPGGRKMGKSEGNVFNIKEALALFPAEALRIYYLQVHYRSPLPWSIDGALPDALGMLARLYEAKEVAVSMSGDDPVDRLVKELGADAKRVVELSDGFRERFYGAMDDDFNTAKALGYAFELARAVNRFANHKQAKKRGAPIAKRALEAFGAIADALGLLQQEPSAFFDEVKEKRLPTLGLTSQIVEAKLAERAQARKDKDWARADELRNELEGKGIQVMDRADGFDWRVRLDVRESE
jgi:cysteinyl-tRNA synthetase